MTLEVVSFGRISQLFENLREMRVQKSVARIYGLPLPLFISWVHVLSYIRNICAHHARLWNRRLNVTPVKPSDKIDNWLVNQAIPNNKLYFVIFIIARFLEFIPNSCSFTRELNSLLKKHPHIDVAAMGFPANWEDEPLFTILRLRS
jgi:abortive infection bacteriophage resistance protein